MISGMVSSVNGKVDTSGTNLAVDSDAQFADAGTIRNIAIGTDALDSTTDAATDNIAIGINALTALTTGDYNVAIGNTAMDAVTSSAADYNIAIGFEALAGGANTGDSNIAIGRQAFNHVNSAADGVVSIGYGTCQGNATSDADGTVAIGLNALQQLTEGEANIAIGSTAGNKITSADHCIAIGKQAMAAHTVGVRNIAIGHQAMLATDATAAVGGGTGGTPGTLASADNIFIGFQSGGGTWDDEDSNYNVAIGNYTMDAAMDGVTHTVAVGYNAGSAITSAGYNTLLGSRAGLSLTTGADNVVIGNAAMSSSRVDATACVAIGGNALGGTHANTASSYCVAIGNQALGGACDDADYNTCVGYQAGDGITTGKNNTGIGASVAFDVDADNQTCVGYQATTDSANDIAIGNTSVDEVKGQVDFTTFSDKRIKKNIKDNDLGLDFINLLKPRKFNKVDPAKYPKSIKRKLDGVGHTWTKKQDDKVWDGLIAQEVKSAIDTCNTTFSGWSEESNSKQLVGYSTLVVPLIKAVQELSQQVKDLQTKIGDA